MSDAVYPILPGLAWSVTRTAVWSSNPQRSKSGRRYAVGDRLYPTWQYTLPYEFLRQYGTYNELKTLIGFVNARRGALASFLYRDPDDYQVANQAIGLGDGVTRSFPFVRDLGGFVEPVTAADVVVHLAVNGVDAAYGTGAGQWLVDGPGAPNLAGVIFNSPPAPNALITWSGTYYWRCAFTSDAIPFEQFMKGFHKASIEFESEAL